MQGTILVVEDDPDIAELVEYNLSREGYSIICADTGDGGLRRAMADAPSLVLLDLMLPGLPGFEVCRQIKRSPIADTPIIMLTAKGEEADVVAGLELGADDYITKPFSVRELIARVNSVLRRSSAEADSAQKIVCGDLMIDTERHEVYLDDEPVTLTLAEYRLLSALASSPGRVYSRERLVQRITSSGHHISERNIDVHIAALRRKLGAAAAMIETVRGVGYKFDG
jgi:two-component system alkaline phosphatase synthesis response regulator PhoP